MKFSCFYLLPLLFILPACSSTGYLVSDDGVQGQYDPVWYEDVEVYSTQQTSKPFRVIGPVIASLDAGQNAEASVKRLRKQAAKMGGDAIVDLRISFSQGFWLMGVEASGLAVKYE